MQNRFANGLRRNGARVKTHAADHFAPINQRDALAKLGSTKSSFLPGRARTDNRKVVRCSSHTGRIGYAAARVNVESDILSRIHTGSIIHWVTAELVIESSPVQPKAKRNWRRSLFRALLTILTAIAAWWICFCVYKLTQSRRDSTILIAWPLLVMIVVTASLVLLEFRWYRPRRKLIGLMARIEAGELPIKSLEEVGGSMKPVAVAVEAVFHHTRSLKKKIAEQDAEMTVKVQNRTDAMERVIGGLRQQTLRDPLTGLLNRRALDEVLPKLIDQCRARCDDLSLLMMDVDYFKQLNDQLGHPEGDRFLQALGQIFRSSMSRSNDVAFRCGGDEFVMVLPGCPRSVAKQRADTLIALAGQLADTMRSNPKPGLSIGLCSISELPSPIASEILREADARLYEMKQRRGTRQRGAA